VTYRGVVFDFNGTLLWDMDLHNQVWKSLGAEYRGHELTDDELNHHVIGRTNAEIWPWLLGHTPSAAELHRLSEAKEATYRDLLVPGLSWPSGRLPGRRTWSFTSRSSGWSAGFPATASFLMMEPCRENHIPRCSARLSPAWACPRTSVWWWRTGCWASSPHALPVPERYTASGPARPTSENWPRSRSTG